MVRHCRSGWHCRVACWVRLRILSLADKAKTEKVMKSNAWRIGTLMAISVFVLLLATSAYGRTSTRFAIPFQFLAGDQMMPAGQYSVRLDLGTRTQNLRHESDQSMSSLRVIPGKRSLDQVEEGRLLFKAYGNAGVLAKVWTRGGDDASDLPVSKAERELVRTVRAGSPIEIAFAPAKQPFSSMRPEACRSVTRQTLEISPDVVQRDTHLSED